MVRLYEYESKDIFASVGMKMPKRHLMKDADDVPKDIKYPFILKSQVLTGGRGKLGGVVEVSNKDDLKTNYNKLMNLPIKGYHPIGLLIEEKVDFLEEYYLALTVDRFQRRPLLIFSKEGGINIEDKTESVFKLYMSPLSSFESKKVRSELIKTKLDDKILDELMDFIEKCHTILHDNDANLVEINPIVRTKDGLIAVDAHVEIDDNAIFRQEKFKDREKEELSADEYEAKSKGMAYVELDQEKGIGLICNGAGLVMATMDLIVNIGGVPANFLDVGGGADAERLYYALNMIAKKPGIDVIFINIFGGITRCDEIAKGIIRFLDEQSFKIVIRMIGTNFKEGQQLLLEKNIKSFESLEDALEDLKTYI